MDIYYIDDLGNEVPTQAEPYSIGVVRCQHCGELLALPSLDDNHFLPEALIREALPHADDPWWTSDEFKRQHLESRQERLIRLQALNAPKIIIQNQKGMVSMAEERCGLPITFPEELAEYKRKQEEI